MQTAGPPAPVSKKMLWAGRAVSALPALLLLISGVMKLTRAPGVAEGFEHLGWPVKYALTLGVLEVGCTLIYLIPRTAILGAILLTGYLGGAVATHLRMGEPQCVGGVVVGVLVWLGLFLRDPRLRTLIPLRSMA